MLDEDDDVQHDDRRARVVARERKGWGGSSLRAGRVELMSTTTIKRGVL